MGVQRPITRQPIQVPNAKSRINTEFPAKHNDFRTKHRFSATVSYSSHVEPPRRQIAFETIVPFRPLNVSKSPENPLKPKFALKPVPKPVIYMKNLRLTTPKTTEQLIQKYSTPEEDDGAVKKVGTDQVGSGDELNIGGNTSISSPSSVTTGAW